MKNEFRIGTGLFGITAGTVRTYKDGHQEWVGEQHDVTEDCIKSVISWFNMQKIKESGVYTHGPSGKRFKLVLEEVEE